MKRDAGTREKDGDVIEIVGIDKLVPADHLLRKIEAAVDFNRLYETGGPLYCEDNGRPSVAPVAQAWLAAMVLPLLNDKLGGTAAVQFQSNSVLKVRYELQLLILRVADAPQLLQDAVRQFHRLCLVWGIPASPPGWRSGLPWCRGRRCS